MGNKNLEASSFKRVAVSKSENEFLPMSESSTMVLSVVRELVELRTFQEAWNHPDIKQCMKWREAIRMEFADMNKQQVWCKIKQV